MEYMREQVIDAIEREKLIVIVRGVAREDLIPLAEAMYAGGIRLMEVTYDAGGRIPHAETASRIGMLAEHFTGRMLIGAGTVLDEECVRLTGAAGGRFIISPDTDPCVIRATRAAGLVSIPGALTPTEVAAAHRAGADFVKLFPVDAFGPAYVKAIGAPLSHVKLLAVGGVTLENIGAYAKAGAVGFGIGSSIVSQKLIAAGDFAAITEMARRYVETVKA